MDDCLVCERIRQTEAGRNPYFVRELKSGYVVLGDHQRFEGYTLLLCRHHATELHQLSPEDRAQFLMDMALTAQAVDAAFHPDKMNYELLGAGRGQHMHWHLFPRRMGDTPTPGPVWQLGSAMNDPACIPDTDHLAQLRSQLDRELIRLMKVAAPLRDFSWPSA